MAATLSLKHLFPCPCASSSRNRGSLIEKNFPVSVQVKKELNLEGKWRLSTKHFRLNCSGHRELDGSFLQKNFSRSFQVKKELNLEGKWCLSTKHLRLNCSDKLDFVDREPGIWTLFSEFDPYDEMITSLEMAPIERSVLENALIRFLAKLEKADQAFCFRHRFDALDAATRLVRTGQEILVGDDINDGADRFITSNYGGLVVKRVNMSDLSQVAAVIGPRTKLVWLESPTNLGLQVVDIQRISEMAHAYGAFVLVDNTNMSPVLSQPLKLGADIVMHAATTLIAGTYYSAGVVFAVKGESLAKKLCRIKNAFGSFGFSPINYWFCLSGIKTMALRVEKQQENAQKIAKFLASHPIVKKVNYIGLSGHPGRDLHYSQAKGAGYILSFVTGSLPLSKHVVETTKWFAKVNNFAGSMNSLISLPCFKYDGSKPSGVREARGLTEDLVRISVGTEDVDDLIADLDNALRNGPL